MFQGPFVIYKKKVAHISVLEVPLPALNLHVLAGNTGKIRLRKGFLQINNGHFFSYNT